MAMRHLLLTTIICMLVGQCHGGNYFRCVVELVCGIATMLFYIQILLQLLLLLLIFTLIISSLSMVRFFRVVNLEEELAQSRNMSDHGALPSIFQLRRSAPSRAMQMLSATGTLKKGPFLRSSRTARRKDNRLYHSFQDFSVFSDKLLRSVENRTP